MKQLVERVLTEMRQAYPADKRFVVGIVGFPGAGKSTLSGGLVAALNETLPPGQKAQVLPMDGYHLPNSVLANLGLRPLKGIPETFDAKGFSALLTQVREFPPQKVFAPAFDRVIDGSIPDAIEIGPDVKVVVVEGNYLLLDRDGWREIEKLLDDTWFLDTSFETIQPRLIARHIAGGRSKDEAIEKMQSTDLPNARLVDESRKRAKISVRALDITGCGESLQYEIVCS